MKKLISVILSTVILLALFLMWIMTSTLLAPVSRIEKNILKDIPLGTSLDDVLVYAENEKYSPVNVNDCVGLLRYSNGNIGWCPIKTPIAEGEQVGVKSIQATVDCYGFILETEVIVFIAFDEKDQLIFLKVEKSLAL